MEKQTKKTNTKAKVKAKKNKNTIEYLMKNKRMVVSVILCAVVLLISLLFLATYFRNYGKAWVKTNKKNSFTISDLTVNNLKYGDKESTVKKTLGQPKSSKEKTGSKYKYKVLEYKGLTLTLKEFYNDYVLVKAEITAHKYKGPRKIRVNKKITKVFKKFKIENSRSAYLYGNYSNKALKDSENTSNVYFGLRSSKNVLYVNRDAKVEGLPTNTAILNIEYYHGRVKKITWSYDVEEN